MKLKFHRSIAIEIAFAVTCEQILFFFASLIWIRATRTSETVSANPEYAFTLGLIQANTQSGSVKKLSEANTNMLGTLSQIRNLILQKH